MTTFPLLRTIDKRINTQKAHYCTCPPHRSQPSPQTSIRCPQGQHGQTDATPVTHRLTCTTTDTLTLPVLSGMWPPPQMCPLNAQTYHLSKRERGQRVPHFEGLGRGRGQQIRSKECGRQSSLHTMDV